MTIKCPICETIISSDLYYVMCYNCYKLGKNSFIKINDIGNINYFTHYLSYDSFYKHIYINYLSNYSHLIQIVNDKSIIITINNIIDYKYCINNFDKLWKLYSVFQ